jgi:hypothetical protein
MLADLAVLSQDFFSVDEEEIKAIESVLTVVGGDIVYGAAEFTSLGPPPIPVLPEWSPVQKVPGHWRRAAPQPAQPHGPAPPVQRPLRRARPQPRQGAQVDVPVSDFGGFWGAFGCSCFAF